MEAALDLRYGKLRLKTLSLVLPQGSDVQAAKVEVDGTDKPVAVSRQGDWISLVFSSDLLLSAGQNLKVTIAP